MVTMRESGVDIAMLFPKIPLYPGVHSRHGNHSNLLIMIHGNTYFSAQRVPLQKSLYCLVFQHDERGGALAVASITFTLFCAEPFCEAKLPPLL